MKANVSFLIDVDLLRKQRNVLLKIVDLPEISKDEIEALDGLINMLDATLDQAEGY